LVGISHSCTECFADLISPSIFAAPSVGSPAVGLFELLFQPNQILLGCSVQCPMFSVRSLWFADVPLIFFR
jgi:hypothetical protein